MAGRKPERPRSVSSLGTVGVDDPATQRALDAVTAAVVKLQASRERDQVTVDLIIGTNRVRHGLGRPAVGYTVTPTFLTIAFGHALAEGNSHPDREIWIDVVGSDQFGAKVEIW